MDALEEMLRRENEKEAEIKLASQPRSRGHVFKASDTAIHSGCATHTEHHALDISLLRTLDEYQSETLIDTPTKTLM